MSVLHVDCDINDTMKDLKLKRAISGLGGADCIICSTKSEDWVNPQKIRDGFPINHSNAETVKLYEQLVTANGEIPRQKGDFAQRKGLTKKPLTSSDQHSICITHSWINSTTWFLKLLYRLNQSCFTWKQSKYGNEERIQKGKDKVFNIINDNTGLVLDVVCQWLTGTPFLF